MHSCVTFLFITYTLDSSFTKGSIMFDLGDICQSYGGKRHPCPSADRYTILSKPHCTCFRQPSLTVKINTSVNNTYSPTHVLQDYLLLILELCERCSITCNESVGLCNIHSQCLGALTRKITDRHTECWNNSFYS